MTGRLRLLADEHVPSAVITYTSSTPRPGDIARALRRIDRQFDSESLADELLWLSDWL